MNLASLYIHIPFCVKKCVYCDFFSVPYDKSLAHAYTDALCKELHMKSTSADCLKTVYIGGGTPSLLPDAYFTKIFTCLEDNFRIAHDAEISVEANPGTMNQAKVSLLLSLGVTRISLGVQSLNDDELKFLGRIHTAYDALRSLELIKKTGLQNFSVDLMYGVPGQSMDTWHETLSKAVGSSPMHISTYELTLEEGTPLYNMRKNGITMSEEDLVLDMYNHAIDYLTMHGYQQYEISNFAYPGFRCLHNLNYWNRGGYIGAGAGAHSFANGVRSHNTKNVDDYIERLNRNFISEIESIKISPTEILKEFLFLGLRKTDGVSISEAKNHGLDIISAGREFIKTGYLERIDASLRLTRKGIVISNSVIVRLFEELGL